MRQIILLIAGIVSISQLYGQDNCSSAISLCANNSINRTTSAATVQGSDPALSCGDGVLNNNVWFTVTAINIGTCTVTVNNIDNNPGLDMQVYTGACGSLVSVGACTSGSSATGRTMNVSFPITTGVTYYIMVDGNAGNQEAFDIVATTLNNSIVARPDANFNTNPSYGCIPLNVLLENTATIYGGTNITYDWRIDGGGYVSASGLDTTVVFNTIGTHTIVQRVCNNQCGCKTISQDVVAQTLVPLIYPNPSSGGCLGAEIFFDGDAIIQPDPPFVDPNVTTWDWDFGDPASGINNTASGQNVSHVFTGPQTSYTVQLTIDGTCGPATITQVITLLPQPIVNITGPLLSCEGQPFDLTADVTGNPLTYTYDWVGPATFSCGSCQTTTLTNLTVGGPYTIDVTVTDVTGCFTQESVDVFINEIPVVFTGGSMTVCSSDSAVLMTFVAGGTSPYSYLWSPSAGLSSDTVDAPFTYNTNSTTYCVTVTDANGCTSNPDCIFLDRYSLPTIDAASANICASAAVLQNTFTVNGAAPGSNYSWGLSPDYSLITSAAPDSSFIVVDFPPNIVATYNFSAIVNDAGTGCTDTVLTTFDVTSGLSMLVTGPSSFCSGDSITLDASGANTYAWSANPPYTFADSTLATQVVSPLVPTQFTVYGTQGGCDQTINYIVNVDALPYAEVQAIPSFCGCSTVTLDGNNSTAGMTYQWTSSIGSPIANANDALTTAQPCLTDTFFLRVTDPSTGCYSDTSAIAISFLKPAAIVTVTPDLICNGVSTYIVLDGSGSDANVGTMYNWTSNDPSVIITDVTMISTDATVDGSVIFYLTVTDAFGCDSTASDTVKISPPPTISVSAPFLCSTAPVLLSTISIAGASSGSTYDWTLVPACVTPTTSTLDTETFDFTTCGAGTYSFDISVNDPVTTCMTDFTQDIIVVDGVTLVTSADTTFCEGGVATLIVSGANTYTWSTGSTTDTIVVAGLTAAGSPYMFTVDGFIGSCTASKTITVTVDSIPATGPITGLISVCANDSSIYNVTPTAGNYTWSVTNGLIMNGQGTNSIQVNWNANGTGTINVVDTNAFGCPGPNQTLNVTINARPDTITITGPSTACPNTSATYFVLPTAGSTYFWNIAGGNYAAGNSGAVNSFIWGNPGIGTLSIIETNGAGCLGPASFYNVTINPRPVAPILFGNSIVCDNVTEYYVVSAAGGSTYNWSVVNAQSNSVNSSGDTLTISWGNPGVGLITLSETNSFGCTSDTVPFNVSIIGHPLAQINPDSLTICNNNSIQLFGTANSSFIQWYSDGNGTFSDTTIASPVYTAALTDTGYIHVTMVVSNLPCVNDTARLVIYQSAAPVLTVSATLSTICFGSPTTLSATGGSAYLWTPGGSMASVITVQPTVSTTYSVSTTNSFGCTSNDTIRITVIPPGIPDAGSSQDVCIGDSVQLTGTQQNAGGVVWSSLGDGVFIPNTNDPNAQYIPGTIDTTNGSLDIILTTTGACLNQSDTISVSIQLKPTIEAGRDTVIASGPGSNATVPLQPVGTNLAGVLWTSSGSGTFSPSDTSLNAVYTPSNQDFSSTSLLLIVTTTGSCQSISDFITVDFTPFIVPNSFTPYPSSPGKNDFFFIPNLPVNSKLQVWDRWGMLVYLSDNYLNNWDANGLKSDTYYYVLETTTKSYKSWVSVFRD